MKRISHAVIGIAAVAAFSLGAAGALNAQGKGAPARHAGQMAKPASPQTTAPKTESSFRGIAAKLGTTPDALEQAYATAKQANPKLSRGNFVAANMIAHNLSAKNPSITTSAILSGLQSGKSVGQTLQGLGLSADQAADAEKQARRDAAAAQHSPDAAPAPTKP